MMKRTFSLTAKPFLADELTTTQKNEYIEKSGRESELRVLAKLIASKEEIDVELIQGREQAFVHMDKPNEDLPMEYHIKIAKAFDNQTANACLCHEAAHVVFTAPTSKKAIEECNKRKYPEEKLHEVINIIEDMRINSMIKNIYLFAYKDIQELEIQMSKKNIPLYNERSEFQTNFFSEFFFKLAGRETPFDTTTLKMNFEELVAEAIQIVDNNKALIGTFTDVENTSLAILDLIKKQIEKKDEQYQKEAIEQALIEYKEGESGSKCSGFSEQQKGVVKREIEWKHKKLAEKKLDRFKSQFEVTPEVKKIMVAIPVQDYNPSQVSEKTGRLSNLTRKQVEETIEEERKEQLMATRFEWVDKCNKVKMREIKWYTKEKLGGVINKPKAQHAGKKLANKLNLIKQFARVQKGATSGTQLRVRQVVNNLLSKQSLVGSKIFYKKQLDREKSLAVMLLVDFSGSMGQVVVSGTEVLPKHSFAKQSCLEYATALESLGVNYAIWGFSSDSMANPLILRIKEFKKPFRLSVLDDAGYAGNNLCQNNDGGSIRLATGEIMRQSQAKKVIMVISDGQPSHSEEAVTPKENTFNAVQEARNRGISVLGVGIEGVHVEVEKKIYGEENTIILEGKENSLGKELLSIIQKNFL